MADICKVEMRGVKAPFVINMFYFCDPDGHGPYVQCRDAMPVDEYTPKLGSLTMENIVATVHGSWYQSSSKWPTFAKCRRSPS